MVSIDKIELKIGNKTVTLSLEQLQELKDVLDKLFAKPIVIGTPYYPITWPVPYVPMPSPWRWDNGRTWSAGVQDCTLQLSCHG